ELFGTRLRYSGASIGYQLAAPVAGGLAPLIATGLTQLFPGQRWPLAVYIALLSAISLACVLRLSETSRRSLPGQEQLRLGERAPPASADGVGTRPGRDRREGLPAPAGSKRAVSVRQWSCILLPAQHRQVGARPWRQHTDLARHSQDAGRA